MVITIKEFVRTITKVLREVNTSGDEIVITKHGEPYVKVVKVITNPQIKEPLPPKVITSPARVRTIFKNSVLEYGCGCPKTDMSQNLCEKHNRV